MGEAILWLFNTLIGIYIWLIIIMAVMSWLVAFNVVNLRHPFVYRIDRFLTAATEPVLRPVRRVIPPIGGMDLSPIVVIFGLEFIQIAVNRELAPLLVNI